MLHNCPRQVRHFICSASLSAAVTDEHPKGRRGSLRADVSYSGFQGPGWCRLTKSCKLRRCKAVSPKDGLDLEEQEQRQQQRNNGDVFEELPSPAAETQDAAADSQRCMIDGLIDLGASLNKQTLWQATRYTETGRIYFLVAGMGSMSPTIGRV